MSKTFTVNQEFNVPAEKLYSAWLDSKGHSEITGAAATSGNQVGDVFSAWDGYISGTNVELKHAEKIVQRWRTTQFSEDESDSIVEIIFENTGSGTLVTICHSALPEHGEQYRQGWVDHYFAPIQKWIATL
jgi:activator of HSP90 ATPase